MTDRRKRSCSCICVNLAIFSVGLGRRSIFITAPVAFGLATHFPSPWKTMLKVCHRKKKNYFKTTNLSIHATHMKSLLHP